MMPISTLLAPAREQALSLLRQHEIDTPPVSFGKILTSL